MSRDYFSRKKRAEKLHSIIKPSLEELSLYDSSTGVSIKDTFAELVTKSLNLRAELEDVPPLLYKNKDKFLDYITRSEIHIVCQMIRYLMFSMGGKFNPAEIPSIFAYLANLGIEKEWDIKLFHQALTESVGITLGDINSMGTENPSMRDIDYN